MHFYAFQRVRFHTFNVVFYRDWPMRTLRHIGILPDRECKSLRTPLKLTIIHPGLVAWWASARRLEDSQR
jgi:hypothetical protein